MIDTLFIFAAGKGTRMQDLSTGTPKPLIKIANKPLLQYNLELALNFPFKKIIINTHYLADQIINFVGQFKASHINLPEITIIYEPILLETGGAIKNASQILDLQQPIFTLNSDVIIKTKENIFEIMLQNWNASKMDFLLFLQNYNDAIGYKGIGDFEILSPSENDNISIGKLTRMRNNSQIYSYMYAGLSIIKPSTIRLDSNKIFSLSNYYHTNGNTYGLTIENSKWYHASGPEDIEEITNKLCG